MCLQSIFFREVQQVMSIVSMAEFIVVMIWWQVPARFPPCLDIRLFVNLPWNKNPGLASDLSENFCPNARTCEFRSRIG